MYVCMHVCMYVSWVCMYDVCMYLCVLPPFCIHTSVDSRAGTCTCRQTYIKTDRQTDRQTDNAPFCIRFLE